MLSHTLDSHCSASTLPKRLVVPSQPFQHLTSIRLYELVNLRSVRLASPVVEHLALHECTTVRWMEVACPSLKSLKVATCPCLRVIALAREGRLQSLTVSSCKALFSVLSVVDYHNSGMAAAENQTVATMTGNSVRAGGTALAGSHQPLFLRRKNLRLTDLRCLRLFNCAVLSEAVVQSLLDASINRYLYLSYFVHADL